MMSVSSRKPICSIASTSLHLSVDVLQEAGEDLLHTRVEAVFVRRARVPRRDRTGPRCQLGVLGDKAKLLLLIESSLALAIPAVIEFPFVLLSPLLGRVVR